MKYTKAVSATLAGALAVGMVPAMALATEGDDLELLAQDSVAAFEAGTVVAVDAAGNAVDMSDTSKAVAKFTFNEKAQYVKPTAVDLNIDGVNDVKVDGVKVKAAYYAATVIDGVTATSETSGLGYKILDPDKDNNFVEHIKAVGVYKVVITVEDATSPYNTGSIAYAFEIVKPSLTDAFVYEKNADDPKDVSDVTLNYTGGNLRFAPGLGIALGESALEYGSNADYVLSGEGLYTDNGSGLYTTPATEVIYKGSYAWKVSASANGDYAGTDVLVPFTVNAADLSKENLLVTALEAGKIGDQVSDKGVADLDLIAGETLVSSVFTDANFQLVAKTDADKVNDFSTPGSYDYVLKLKATAAADVKANVTGEKEVSIDVVGTKLLPANFFYNGAEFGSTASITVDLSNPNAKPFDADLVYAEAGLTDVPVQLVVTDADGKPASVEDLGTPGTWTVRAVADVAASGYAYGGTSDAITVTVLPGELALDKAVFMSDGAIISGTSGNEYEMTFSNADLLAGITASVKTASGKTLVAGTDYELVAYDEDGEKVSEMKDAGKYEVRIVSAKYGINVDEDELNEAAILYVEVKPVAANWPAIDNLIDTSDKDTKKEEFLYTGSAIVPVFSYTADKGADGTGGTADDARVVIPADAYELGFTDVATGANSAEMVEEGTYQITVTFKNDNYVFNGDVSSRVFGPYKVVDEWLYVDVPSTAWFADEVRLATELEYMTGYYGGKNFGPYDSAERQDVALVIGRMAGVGDELAEGSTSNMIGFETPFSDVKEGAYYAKAVQWINKAGIMTGYSANDEFGVNDQILRQDLAVALYRYAQKYQRGFEAPADVAGALAAYADGAEVSGYAKTAVAWAIEQGIMGVDTAVLNPADDITRAELAAMTTRLQPKAL